MSLTYVLLFFAIIAEIIATMSLKATDGFTKIIPTLIVLACYLTAFYLLSIIVKTLPVGVVYALWCGIGIVGTAVLAYFVYGQKLSLPTLGGMALIMIGAIIVQLSNPSH